MKNWNITQLLMNDSSNYDYKFTITNESGSTSDLFTSDEFKTIIKMQYTSFSFLSPAYYDSTQNKWIDILEDESQAITALHQIYDIWKKDRTPAINKLVEALRKKYNPIWNVDGVTGHIDQSTHTGTDTDKKTGTENILTEDNGSITNTGKKSNVRSGNTQNVRTGSEKDALGGSDTETTGNTTYNDDTYNGVNKITNTYGKTDTKTYNSVTDKETYNNITDAETIDANNPLREQRDLDGKHNTTFNTQLQKTLNLTDKNVSMDIRQGNIGVTSTQKLINEQIELTELDEVITYVIHDFVHRYLVILS